MTAGGGLDESESILELELAEGYTTSSTHERLREWHGAFMSSVILGATKEAIHHYL